MQGPAARSLALLVAARCAGGAGAPSSSSSSIAAAAAAATRRGFARAAGGGAPAAAASPAEDRKAANRTALLVKALTPQPPPPRRPASPEDAARAKAYARARMAAHRAWQADLVGKLALKQAAVAALPAGPVRDAAAAADLTPFPASRAVWTETPPIPGFSARQSEALGSQVKETVSKRAATRRGGRV